MPPVMGGSSSASESVRTTTIAEHIRLRRPRNEITQLISAESDPLNPSSSRSKSATKKKLNNFRGFGCTASASQQVSLPAVIRTSADWDGKKVKKKKQHKKNSNSVGDSHNTITKAGSYSNNNNNKSNGVGGDGGNSSNNNCNNSSSLSYNSGNCMVIQDVWCGPGIGFSADAVVGSVDCVVARRNANASGRGKIDGEKVNQRERERERERERSCLSRRTVNTEGYPFLESEGAFTLPRPELDVFGSRYCRHVRHPSPDDLAEIMLLQNSFMLGGRVESHDHFRDWRLDVDNMTYEELLELGERIGHVSTGLKEDELGQCIRRIKNSIINDFPSHLPVHVDKKCTICQEEYEADDEMGKLECGHSFHIHCIKQWLSQKHTCPVCKKDIAARCC